MNKKVPNVREATKDDKEKLRLAKEIKILLPHITDEIHMRTAIMLGCEYKVVKSYLAGKIEDKEFAQQVIDMVRVILKGQHDKSEKGQDDEKTGDILRVGMLVALTQEKCKAIMSQLQFLEKVQQESFERLKLSVNGIAKKIGVKA